MALVRWDGSRSSVDWSTIENDIKSELRDLKIKVIGGDFEFSFSDVNIKRHKEDLNFILDNLSSDDIITGSLSLKLYGLLDREIGDIDIIIDDEKRYSGYFGGHYGDIHIDNRLGYKNFKNKRGIFSWSSKETMVDFFKNSGVRYDEVEFRGKKLKVHNPFDIINLKSNMFLRRIPYQGSHLEASVKKHYDDLVHIFNRVNFVY